MKPDQRWQMAVPSPIHARELARSVGLPALLGQVLLNRGYETTEEAQLFFEPERWTLPDPGIVFEDLGPAVTRLARAVTQGEKIAICGDYDCDGMTSTALLMRAFRAMGCAQIDFAIPDRLQEGYGVNTRMVQDLAATGYRVLITVDNGISALAPLQLAQQLGLDVIITDHHDLPPVLPPAIAILNPKLLPEASPYHSLAGVGMAYILALALATALGHAEQLRDPLLELFTLGTVADMAPLTGVNRLWTQRGLRLLPYSQNPGIQALMAVAGFTNPLKELKPEAIGFGLGPRINAVGRIGDPTVIIRLLTTDDPAEAYEVALECEQTNRRRQELCAETEAAALALVESLHIDLTATKVLVIAGEHWHHGIVGLVASRLKERFGCPCFVGVLEPDSVRGSARGIPEFNIFEALSYCREHLGSFGGHPMAGGFGCKPEQWPLFQAKLETFAQTCLTPDLIKPLVEVDVEARLGELSLDLLDTLDRFHPCGMHNPDPVFWSRALRVVKQQTMGKTKEHVKFSFSDGKHEWDAVAWRWAGYLPLPETVDIAYKLQENIYQGKRSLQLSLEGVRPASAPLCTVQVQAAPLHSQAEIITPQTRDPLGYLADLAQTGNVLVYGFDRPTLPGMDQDRPKPGKSYAHVVFWSQPPAPVHGHWLIAHTQATQVHLLLQPVGFPDWETLLDLVCEQIEQTRVLNLLQLGQQHWLSPHSLLEALHELRVGLELNPGPLWGVNHSQLTAWYKGQFPLYPPTTKTRALLKRP